ncbi:thermonuclease family protein [Synechococcus sp. BA-132 BA5]|uniref:thermonuclease family protein n=1 Tax=Synechococcus sp. BA-132 BA5 TaxID=3110252 RepID=UPI002B2102DB|nr:thermonuclease family protein [Synechococcus sp. BA-132 BA5]MEA5413714.1 thermonuclease family protein [Synechococcus sp. BA-132 BA5]
MHRAFVGLSALLLSAKGAPVLAIPPPPPNDVRIVKVLDGRTIVVTPYGEPFKVRLACILAPQPREGSSDLAAKATLEGLLQPGTWVTLSTRSKTADGVELAEIIPVGSTLPINLRLVQTGLAALDRRAASPCNQQIYREAELRAQAMQLGLWRPSPGTGSRQP